jgi:Protein of unknown function (DUF1552)
MTQPQRIGRRHFLLGTGGLALAIPVLPSLLRERTAQAGGGSSARNFVSWRITNGVYGHQWFPSDAATTGPSGLQVVAPNVREMLLADIDGPISPLLDAGFDPFRSKAILMRHIDRLDLADHTAGTGLWGWSSNPDNLVGIDVSKLPSSIDRLIAERADIPAVPLNLAVRWSEQGASCSFSTTAQGQVVMETGLYPDQAFQQLFVGLDVDDVTAERLRQQKLTLVDRSLEHYLAVRNNPRLSAADRDLLDEHIEHMQKLEQLLSADAIECSPPADPGQYQFVPEAVDAAAQAQVDIAVAALRCGLTRVVNFYLDPDTLMTESLHGVVGGHHGASHDSSPQAVDSILNAHRWHMRYLFDFLGKLDATVDPLSGATLLDDSLVLVNNEIGNQSGQSGTGPTDLDNNHLALDIQTMIIGSCGGVLRTGTYLDYRTDFTRNRWSEYVGTAYNGLLVSCMLAFGLSPEDWEVDGQPGYGDMRGSLYDMTPLDQVVIGDLRSFLPRLEA